MVTVSVNKVVEGCIVANDVFSKTNYPIITEKTVITAQHLKILKLFLIDEIDVEPTLVTGDTFIKSKQKHQAVESVVTNNKEEDNDFLKLFLKAIKSYEKEFRSWQSGLNVDVAKIRTLIHPLIDAMEKESINIFSLHHYATKENYYYQHSVAVGLLSSYIARKLNFPKGEIMQVALAGCLANCGMSKVDPKLLIKESALTREEYTEIKKHPILSYRMIEETPLLKDESKLAVLQHHERVDGSGYPMGEKGNKIHQYAKIIAVAEVYHAMTSERLYKNKRSPFKVIEMMLEDFFGQFDIVAIQKLSSAIMVFSNGSKVQLSDGRIAEIIFTDSKHPARPLVKIVESDEIVKLVEERQLSIQKIIEI